MTVNARSDDVVKADASDSEKLTVEETLVQSRQGYTGQTLWCPTQTIGSAATKNLAVFGSAWFSGGVSS